MNRVRILFFATLKEKAGMAEMDMDIPEGIAVSDFKDFLFKKFPQLPQSRANVVVAINKEFAFDQEQIPNGAEIALFPPVSGG
jgi:molybdopterin converting factor subunit 1